MHRRSPLFLSLGRVLPLAVWAIIACKAPSRAPAIDVQVTSTISGLDRIDLVVRQSSKDEVVQQRNGPDGGPLAIPLSVTLTSDSPRSEPFYIAARGWRRDKVVIIRSATVTWPAAGQVKHVCLPLAAECEGRLSCEDTGQTCVAGACSEPIEQCESNSVVEPGLDARPSDKERDAAPADAANAADTAPDTLEAADAAPDAVEAVDTAPQAEDTAVLLRGDVDGDGEITSTDEACILRMFVMDAGFVENCPNSQAADVNKDGKVDMTDKCLVRLMLGQECD
jgi:hypothetical protein